MNRRNRQKLEQKQVDLQNRYIIGIDPAREKLQAQIMGPAGRAAVGSSFTIVASREGFDRLLSKQVPERLPELSRQEYPRRLAFAVEASCNLWQHIVQYLREQQLLVVLVSPLATHHGRPSLSGDFSCTDPKDADIVARIALQGNYFFVREEDEKSRAMHRLSIMHEKLRRSLQQFKLRLRSHMDLNFPEYLEHIELDSATSMYLLKSYVLASDFVGMDIAWEAPRLKKVSHGYYGLQSLERLVESARSSIGIKRYGEERTVERQFAFGLIRTIERLEQDLKDIEEKLVSLSKQTLFHEVITSVKGVGDLLAALYIAELINPGAFRHYKQIQRLAGYNLKIVDSGTHSGPRRISHLGNSRLGWVLFLMTREAIRYVPEVRAKYLRRRLNGHRCWKENVVACVPKVIELLVALCRDGRPYERSEKREEEVADLAWQLERKRRQRTYYRRMKAAA